jgi:hypothetical protein
MEGRSKNNLFSYCVLIVILIIVHFIIVSNPDLAMQPGQRQFFMWPAIGTIGSLGFLGVFLLNFTGLKGLWPADVGIKQKVIFPVIIGLLLGAITSVTDLLTKYSAIQAASRGVESIHTAFPYSIAQYLGGAIEVSILFYFILIPIVVFLVSTKLLKGKAEGVVFWSIGVPVALLEPFPAINHIAQFGTIAIPSFAIMITFNLLAVWFIRKYGFISAIFLRSGCYLIWHILFPLI